PRYVEHGPFRGTVHEWTATVTMVPRNGLVRVLLHEVLEGPAAIPFMHIAGAGKGRMVRAEQRQPGLTRSGARFHQFRSVSRCMRAAVPDAEQTQRLARSGLGTRYPNRGLAGRHHLVVGVAHLQAQRQVARVLVLGNPRPALDLLTSFRASDV